MDKSMNNQDRSVRRRSGFTIVEILVVVVIIAVLASMIVPRFFSRVGQAQHSVAVSNCKDIEGKIEMFALDYLRYPASLKELVERPPDIPEEKWNSDSAMKAKDLKDPWKREFLYRYPGEHGTYDVYSLGADGEEGGEKENADITSWSD